jgi:hypothetical protein
MNEVLRHTVCDWCKVDTGFWVRDPELCLHRSNRGPSIATVEAFPSCFSGKPGIARRPGPGIP